MVPSSPLLLPNLHEPAGGSSLGCCSQALQARLRVLLVHCGNSQHGSSNSSADLAALQALSYEVTTAADAQQAIALLQDSGDFDVVLADSSSVLGSSGPAAAAGERTVFEAAASSGTPLVVLSQHGTPAEAMAAVQAGAADVLERPLCHSKLQTLWQHSVWAALAGSRSADTRHSARTAQQPRQQQPRQKQQQATTPRAAAAGATAAAKLSSPMCFGLLGDCLSPEDGLGALDGLQLPPMLPSQLEFEPLDSLLSDMQATDATAASAAPLMGSLDALAAPGSPSHSNAATAVAASLFGGGASSEQQCSGDTHMVPTELESSCADASSAGSPLTRRRKLRACTSLRSMTAAAAAASGAYGWQAPQWAAAGQVPPPAVGCSVLQPAAMNMNAPAAYMPMNAAGMMLGSQGAAGAVAMQWGSAGCGSSYMGMNMGMNMGMGMGMNMPMAALPGQLPRGMVWGMPVHNVAVAPGIVPAQTQPAAAASGSSGGTEQQQQQGAGPILATPVAPAVQQGGLLPMPPAAMPGTWGSMWPPMCYPMAAAPAAAAVGGMCGPQPCVGVAGPHFAAAPAGLWMPPAVQGCAQQQQQQQQWGVMHCMATATPFAAAAAQGGQ